LKIEAVRAPCLPRPRHRSGFTTVEVLVAIAILTYGLMALASTVGSVIRMVADGQQLSIVATLAAARLETLRCEPCPGVTSGSETVGPYRVTWSVTEDAGGKQVLVAVRYPSVQRVRTEAFAGFLPCGP